VWQVHFPDGDHALRQEVTDDQGGVEQFDRVVFACHAGAVANILRPANFLEESLLRGVKYHDDVTRTDWLDWLESPIHQDDSVMPAQHRAELLDKAAFIIDVDDRGNGLAHGAAGGDNKNTEYTHNLGSWSPAARAKGIAPKDALMFMTQCQHERRKEALAGAALTTFSAPRGHPDLCFRNMAITSQLLQLIQGRRGVFYCSNWTAPGNGHDLSCTVGLSCAAAIGADYPFKAEEGAAEGDAEAAKEAERDLDDCRAFMGI
jgi:predicted NAD/FAD-binding protein